ncbi:N-acetyl-alpha-D-glucosaminyl L-malate synthase [bacterium HR37]|nr:N-acetyl-alpha-D-glucosaminyl L-malate synthase [bacterium HR37]
MRSKARVLFINHSVRDGGPGRSLFYILKYLDKSRIDPYVLVPRKDVFTDMISNEGLGDRIIVERKFPDNILRPRFNTLNVAHEGKFPSVFYRILKITSVLLNVFDLVLFVIMSPFLIRGKRIDLIYSNGTLAKIVGAIIGFVNYCPVIWHVRNIQQTRILRFTINLLSSLPVVKKVICVSHATAKQFYYSRDKLVVIYNGIDAEDFNPDKVEGVLRKEYKVPEGTIILGSVGRVVPRKGYEYLVRAAGVVCNHLGKDKSRIRFVVVGDTPYFFGNNHLGYLRELVKKLNLEDVFIFTGYRRDVRPYLKDFDIFVITSNYPDPFPRSVIEAMAFSLPVVGFRVGGIVEAVEDGVTGILSDPGSVDQMAFAMLKLIQDRFLRSSMGKAGRERVKGMFSARELTREIEKIILGVDEE